MGSRHRARRPGIARAGYFRHAGSWAGLVLAATLSGCLQSTTLGDKAPDSVTIVGTPTWTNGIGQLMALKCVVCHQQPIPDSAPRATPADLTLTQFESQGTLRGAQDILLALRAGILDHALVFRAGAAQDERMPLDFATPLVPSEKSALESWAAATSLPNVAGSTAASDGLLLFAAYCQGCHGVGGKGGLAVAINGGDPANILTAIHIGLTQAPDMISWPGLQSLTSTELQAVANYLSTQ